jgi:hypothetical protein
MHDLTTICRYRARHRPDESARGHSSLAVRGRLLMVPTKSELDHAGSFTRSQEHLCFHPG